MTGTGQATSWAVRIYAAALGEIPENVRGDDGRCVEVAELLDTMLAEDQAACATLGFAELIELVRLRTAVSGGSYEEWCTFHGGPDPDAAPDRSILREPTGDEYQHWLDHFGGPDYGIAVRRVFYGPWEIRRPHTLSQEGPE